MTTFAETDIFYKPGMSDLHAVQEMFDGKEPETLYDNNSLTKIFMRNIKFVDQALGRLGFEEDVFYKHIENTIFKEIHLPLKWLEKGITEPNIASKQKTRDICFFLYEKHQIIPSKIVPSKEEGVTIIYKNYDHNRSLFIEVYNNLEVAALVNDDLKKEIIAGDDIKEMGFNNIIKKLYD